MFVYIIYGNGKHSLDDKLQLYASKSKGESIVGVQGIVLGKKICDLVKDQLYHQMKLSHYQEEILM